MALTTIDAVCSHCKTRFNALPKKTFLGFQQLSCPECRKELVYPLTPGYRMTYWALFAFMMFLISSALARGEYGVTGVPGIAVMIALIRDWSIRDRVEANA
ncbi:MULTISPECIES: hypothetical protein [unclassified Polaromonas]|uniref:hypothetical protein n=1 Tax=unclassified Polaromonas TaxID=2638319 RepID=UPI00129D86C5|nr:MULTISPECIES: hypothetical protein [unclassified Polaromonas]QGJ19866.1 hypothetical protein F7R28_16705 [Polaromonas sp. Pch-P]